MNRWDIIEVLVVSCVGTLLVGALFALLVTW